MSLPNRLICAIALVVGLSATVFGQSGDSPPQIEEQFPDSFSDAQSTDDEVVSSLFLEEDSPENDSAPILLTQAMSEGASSNSGGDSQGNNGTNPAQNITTFIVSNEYYTLDGGNRINTTYTRLKFPWFENRGSILFEVPYVFYDFESTLPNAPELGGLGDIKLQGSYNLWTSEDKQWTFINFLEVFLPTADNAVLAQGDDGNQITAFNLGTGKFVAGPGGGIVYAPAPNFIIAPLYFYEASVFGDDSHPDIRRGKFRLFAMYAWKSGMYALPEFQALTNYLTGDSDFYLAPEVGYSSKGTTAYVKPGIGIQPDPNNREWGLEFGFRVQF